LRQIVRDGGKVPDKFANAPELRTGLQFYIEAFFELDSDRYLGEIPGRIPWTAIKAYAAANELDEDQTADLFYLVRQLDDEHMKRQAERLKKGMGKDNGKNVARPSRPVRKNRR
jgi:hypothetical protein